MWQANDVIVISELHLAGKKGGARKNGRELFQDLVGLEQFLTRIYNDVQGCRVILNGDIFDYLAIPLNPAAKTAVTDFLALPERTGAIINDHTELHRQKTAFRKRNLISRLRQAASKGGFFDVSRVAAGAYRPLSFLIRSGAELLIHGQTHAAKAYKVVAETERGQREGLDLKSNRWARLLRLPLPDESDEGWQQFINLQSDQVAGVAQGFEHLTFARVRFDGKKLWRACLPLLQVRRLTSPPMASCPSAKLGSGKVESERCRNLLSYQRP